MGSEQPSVRLFVYNCVNENYLRLPNLSYQQLTDKEKWEREKYKRFVIFFFVRETRLRLLNVISKILDPPPPSPPPSSARISPRTPAPTSCSRIIASFFSTHSFCGNTIRSTVFLVLVCRPAEWRGFLKKVGELIRRDDADVYVCSP